MTYDPFDPRLTHGSDEKPVDQAPVYLVLSDEERSKGFVKPYRESYRHRTCGTSTSMSRAIAETYARNPWFYGATYCIACSMHRPLSEFTWLPDGEPMSPHHPDWIQPTPEKETKQ